MNFLRFTSAFLVLSMILVGCSQAPQKELPKITPEKQAELDKQHAEVKANLDGQSKPADAPK